MNVIDLVLDNGQAFSACGEIQAGSTLSTPIGVIQVEMIAQSTAIVRILDGFQWTPLRSLRISGNGGWRIKASGIYKQLRETPPYRAFGELLREFGLSQSDVTLLPDGPKWVLQTADLDFPGFVLHFRGDHVRTEIDDAQFVASENIPNCLAIATKRARREGNPSAIPGRRPRIDTLNLFLWPDVTEQNLRDVLNAIRNAG